MKFNLNDYLQMHRKPDGRYSVAPPITCKDGFTISVQASAGHYCLPKTENGPWTAVECGFPSSVPDFIMDYCDDHECPTETVYGYVPIELVEELLTLHGGFSVHVVPVGA